MKRFWILLILMLVFVSGCFINTSPKYHGLYIAGMGMQSQSAQGAVKLTRAGGPIVKDLYCYGYPVNSAYFGLIPVDADGNVITSDTVQWSLDDPSIGILKPDFTASYARVLDPARTGETIVRATDGVYSDEAKIVVFNCKRILEPGASESYFSLDRGCGVGSQEEADIMVKDGQFHFLNEWAKIDQFESLDNLYALTGMEVQLGPPGTAPLWPILFLIKSKSGALYGGLLATFDFAWKLITPAPSPSPSP